MEDWETVSSSILPSFHPSSLFPSTLLPIFDSDNAIFIYSKQGNFVLVIGVGAIHDGTLFFGHAFDQPFAPPDVGDSQTPSWPAPNRTLGRILKEDRPAGLSLRQGCVPCVCAPSIKKSRSPAFIAGCTTTPRSSSQVLTLEASDTLICDCPAHRQTHHPLR